MSIIEKALDKLDKAVEREPRRLPGELPDALLDADPLVDAALQRAADEAVELEFERASPSGGSAAPIAELESEPAGSAATPVGHDAPRNPLPPVTPGQAPASSIGPTTAPGVARPLAPGVDPTESPAPASPSAAPPAADKDSPTVPGDGVPARATVIDARPRPAIPTMPPASPLPPDGTSSRSVDLDLDRLSAMGFVTPNSSNSLLAEQHRLIKRPLLDRAALDGSQWVDNGNLVIVTSSLPGEGKTFVSINLAMSIAMEVDRTVLLVDADIHKSDVTTVLELNESRGLTDYLHHGDIPLSELLLKTNVPKLTLLPAGRRYPNLTELLASENMRQLTQELANRYRDRIVVFDSPPLLATSGASVLISLMGQVVMVVEAVRTSQGAIRESLSLIDSHPHVGIVLNKSRQKARAGYQYGYYYGDGTYGAKRG